jgi:hypothetical protein
MVGRRPWSTFDACLLSISCAAASAQGADDWGAAAELRYGRQARCAVLERMFAGEAADCAVVEPVFVAGAARALLESTRRPAAHALQVSKHPPTAHAAARTPASHDMVVLDVDTM